MMMTGELYQVKGGYMLESWKVGIWESKFDIRDSKMALSVAESGFSFEGDLLH